MRVLLVEDSELLRRSLSAALKKAGFVIDAAADGPDGSLCEHHVHMALYTVFDNWTKMHKTLRTPPAMAAGLAERVCDMADVVAMIEGAEAPVPAHNVSAQHSA